MKVEQNPTKNRKKTLPKFAKTVTANNVNNTYLHFTI